MRAGIGSSKNSATTVDLPLSHTAEAQALVLTAKSMGHTLHKLHFRGQRLKGSAAQSSRLRSAFGAQATQLGAQCKKLRPRVGSFFAICDERRASSRHYLCRGAVFPHRANCHI